MAKRYAGLTGLSYSTDGTTFTAITGKLTMDSTLTPETITTDTTNSRLYGGESFEMNIGVLDDANYAALHAAMLTDTEYFWRFTFAGGSTETTSMKFPFQVVKVRNADKRTGLNAYRISGVIAWNTETLTTA
jgi:hypothetical protein